MHYVVLFFAGAFLCNSIPHLAAGLQGMPFPSPFAQPRGVGNSSALVNFLWGTANLVIGIWLLSRRVIAIGANGDCLGLAAGFLVLGLYLAHHFGKVRQQTVP